MRAARPKSIACDRDLLPRLQENSTSFQMLSLEMSGNFHASPILEKATITTLHISLLPFPPQHPSMLQRGPTHWHCLSRRLHGELWAEKRGIEMFHLEIRQPQPLFCSKVPTRQDSCIPSDGNIVWWEECGFRSLGEMGLNLDPDTDCSAHHHSYLSNRGTKNTVWYQYCNLGQVTWPLCAWTFYL